MASKQTAAILTILGGLCYAAVGGLIALAAGTSGSVYNNLLSNNLYSGLNVSASTFTDILYGVAVFDIIAGSIIVLGGILIKSESNTRRKLGGALALLMMVVGALTSLGGFVIGFILTLAGAILGLTYKPEPKQTAYSYPSATPQPQTTQTAQAPDYTAFPGRTNYCASCGARLRDGSVFCSSCGAKVPS